MKLFPLILLAAIACLFSACSLVTTKHPVTKVTADEAQALLAGDWGTSDGVLHVRFDERGQGAIGWLEWQDGKFKQSGGELHAVADGDEGYLSVRFEEDGKMADHYYLLKYRQCEGGLLLSLADPEKFSELVEKKLLKGTVTRPEKPVGAGQEGEEIHVKSAGVVIESPAAELLSVMGAIDDLFDLEDGAMRYQKIAVEDEDEE
jgi:hypothetical protein